MPYMIGPRWLTPEKTYLCLLNLKEGNYESFAQLAQEVFGI